MDNETPKSGEPQPEAAGPEDEAWQEVGRQFKSLGQSLAAAFHAVWKDEQVRGQARDLKTGLEAMVHDVGQAVREAATSPEVRQATSEAVKAGEQAAREARPHLLEALRVVSRELQTLIDRMEKSEPGAEAGSTPTEPEPPPAD